VEHTGKSRFLPDARGLFRFESPEMAVRYLEEAAANHAEHGAAARALAETHFSAAAVTARVLDRAIG
jgi:hypothetical protein